MLSFFVRHVPRPPPCDRPADGSGWPRSPRDEQSCGAAQHPRREEALKVEYVEESSVQKALAFEIEAEVVEKEIETRARELRAAR